MGRNNRKRPDKWTQKAKEAGFAARSVYKLEEIEKRFQVLQKTKRVLDLGCAPGSWSQFVRKQRPHVKLVGIDIQSVENYPGTFIQQSILDTVPETFLDMLGGTADLVISDMAPNTSGDRFTDHIRQVELAEMALQTALVTLKQNGIFIAKVFDGEDAHPFVLSLSQHFSKVRRVKPVAVRNESVEFFVVCMGKKQAVHWSPSEKVVEDSSNGENEVAVGDVRFSVENLDIQSQDRQALSENPVEDIPNAENSVGATKEVDLDNGSLKEDHSAENE